MTSDLEHSGVDRGGQENTHVPVIRIESLDFASTISGGKNLQQKILYTEDCKSPYLSNKTFHQGTNTQQTYKRTYRLLD